MKKLILILAAALFMTTSAKSQGCLNSTISIASSIAGQQPLVGVSQVTMCTPMKAQFVAFGALSYTWSNGIQGQSIYIGIEGYPDLMALQPGTNFFQVTGEFIENGQTCYNSTNITINVCSTVGINELQAQSEALKIEYTDLLGKPIAAPKSNEICIKRVFYQDCKVTVSKVLLSEY